MTNGEQKIRRTLHVRFTLPGAAASMLPMLKSATPFYQFFDGAEVRLLQNVDDPSRFVQVIEYSTPESVEANRQQIASDARVQAYLMACRSVFPGAVEVDVYQEA